MARIFADEDGSEGPQIAQIFTDFRYKKIYGRENGRLARCLAGRLRTAELARITTEVSNCEGK
jgi:hypothetical protein